jgi:hypothetical protein
MSSQQCTYRFFVTAEPDSTVLACLSDVLACLNLVPHGLHLWRAPVDGSPGLLAIVLIETTARHVDLLQRKIMRMASVIRVECEETAVDHTVGVPPTRPDDFLSRTVQEDTG